MTKVIRDRCPDCHQQIDLPPDAVTIFRRPDGQYLYTFPCSACHQQITRNALPAVALALSKAGVQELALPPAPKVDGPPLRLDELIDLHAELEAWNRGEVA